MSLYVAAALRYGSTNPTVSYASSWVIFLAMAVLGPAIICLCGLPRIKLHTIENDAILRIGLASCMLVVAAMAVSAILLLPGPRSIPLIFGMVYFMSAVSLRVLAIIHSRIAIQHVTQKY